MKYRLNEIGYIWLLAMSYKCVSRDFVIHACKQGKSKFKPDLYFHEMYKITTVI